ncbi:NADH dehydrogenase (ubiquinone)-like protein [Apiospora arundinis]
MKINTLLVLVTALLAPAATDACKCGSNLDATKACCHDAGGIPTSNGCPAGTISERLSRFASCCRRLGVRSDCRCPVGCRKDELQAERKAQGLEPLNDTELLAALHDYEP